MQLKKQSSKQNPMVYAILWGTVIELTITIILCAITAWLISAQKIKLSTIHYAVMLSIMLSAYFGTYIAHRLSGTKKLPVALISAAVFYSIHILITALFFGGSYQALLETGLIFICGSLLYVLTGKRKNIRKNKRISVLRNR